MRVLRFVRNRVVIVSVWLVLSTSLECIQTWPALPNVGA